MRRGMIVVIAGILLLIVTAGVAAYSLGFFDRDDGGDSGQTVATPSAISDGDNSPAEEPTPEVKDTVPVVIAIQNIGRGMEITADAVTLWDWPVDALPPDAVSGAREDDINGDGVPDVIEGVLGLRMRTSAARFEPILSSMVADRIDLTGSGSDAALAIPPGRVLMAYPIQDFDSNPTVAVAYALRPGDHVDLMISLALVDLDDQFHTMLNNQAQILDIAPPAEGEEDQGQKIQIIDFTYGRIEEGPLGLIFNIIPSEPQRPRLVTQLTVQDAVVLQVGRYPTLPEELRGIDPQAPPTPTPVPAETEEEAAPPAEPPPPPKPQVMLLAVTPQEALVIKYAWENNADIDFVLRAVGDQALYQTSAVTLQYLMETYNIEVPPKLQYGIEPPAYKLDSLIEFVEFYSDIGEEESGE